MTDERELLAEIPQLVTARDHERLSELFDREKAESKREPVLTAALEALHTVEEVNFGEHDEARRQDRRRRSGKAARPTR